MFIVYYWSFAEGSLALTSRDFETLREAQVWADCFDGQIALEVK